MIVSIVKNWTEPSILRQTPFNSGMWKGVLFVDYYHPLADVLVVLNQNDKTLVGFHRKRILLSQEPPHGDYNYQKVLHDKFDTVVSFWEDDVSKNRNNANFKSTGLPWHVNKSYDYLKELKFEQIYKDKKLSWITSNLNNRPGHGQRLKLITELKNELKFDLYGRGFNPIADKFDGLVNYEYSIAFENYACPNYWTEKIADCFLAYTLPFYAGCTNILDYFPENSLVVIDFHNCENSIETIKKIIAEKPSTSQMIGIEKSRNLVLDKYCLFNLIYEYIQSINIQSRKFKIIKRI